MHRNILIILASLISISVILFFMVQKGVFVPFIPTPHIAVTTSTGSLVFLQKAREQIGVVTSYDHSNGYYGSGGFPPSDTGVCADVIWRAYRDMGYDFRAMMQDDVRSNPLAYDGDLDSNINYRRVKRLQIYFSKHAQILTNDMKPGDIKNLAEWQPGDIVIFAEMPTSHLWHIAIITDQRRSDGVPYMIDNHGGGVGITMTPLDWKTHIIGHYRVF